MRRTIVALAGTSDDGVRIASGLNAGDMVVTAGVQFLRDGMRVRAAGRALAGAGQPDLARPKRCAAHRPSMLGSDATMSKMPAFTFNLSRWAIGHGGFTAFLLVLLLVAGALLAMADRPEGGPRLHLPRHGGAGAVAGRDHAGNAGSGGRQDRAQAAGNAGPRFPALLHPARLRQHLRQPQGLRCAARR